MLNNGTGTLYVISTPIGNLGDMSHRAIEVLKDVSLVAAEDTRQSKKLFNHYMINTPLTSYFEHNRYSKIPKLMELLISGKDLGLISDAGTPGISDPAYRIVREAIENKVSVIPIPGASAVLSALVASGLPTDRFLYEGFLPPKKGRKKRIENVKNLEATLVYYESPRRLSKTLKQFYQIFGDRPAVVAREITKLHEEMKRGTLSELCAYYNEVTPKGEHVILIGKNDKNVYF